MVDIAKLPAIMRAQTPPWGNAAALMDRWFAGPSAVHPAVAPPDTTTIRMDSWLLSFPRARAVFDHKIMLGEHWKTPKAEQSLAIILARLGKLSGVPAQFGDFGRAVELLDAEYYQGLSVESDLDDDPLDDLFGALAAYNLRLVAAGKTEPADGAEHLVTVDRIGVYVQDKYDFNDEWYKPNQPLGFWNEITNWVSKSPGFGFDYVSNGDFREWRTAHGRGGDFLVYSDVIELAWVILKHAEPTADAVSAWESVNFSTAPKPAQ